MSIFAILVIAVLGFLAMYYFNEHEQLKQKQYRRDLNDDLERNRERKHALNQDREADDENG